MSGFSLIELLVVIAIIGILALMLISSTQKYDETAKLNAAASALNQAIFDARTRAVSSAQYNQNYDASFGVYVTTASTGTPNRTIVTIYADCIADDNNDGSVSTGDNFRFDNSTAECGINDTVKSITLPYDVYVSAITPALTSYSGGNVGAMSILFLRPEPTVWYTLGATNTNNIYTLGEAKITLRTPQGQTKAVIVKSTSQSYVE